MNGICDTCGKTNTLMNRCDCNRSPISFQDIMDKAVTDTCSPIIHDTNALEDLYDELGKLKWAGSDEGWDKAIEAVRAYIRARL